MHATIRNEKTGNTRALLTFEDIVKAQDISTAHLSKVINEKGYGTFTSRHEALGVITLEYNELEEVMQSGSIKNLKDELCDVISACLFSLACLEAETMDW